MLSKNFLERNMFTTTALFAQQLHETLILRIDLCFCFFTTEQSISELLAVHSLGEENSGHEEVKPDAQDHVSSHGRRQASIVRLLKNNRKVEGETAKKKNR